MIELSANSALFAELDQIADINARRANGEQVMGSTEPIVLHVVKPDLPLPLGPGFRRRPHQCRGARGDGVPRRAGDTSTRDQRSACRSTSRPRKMRVAPLGCRISLRMRGSISTLRGDRSRFVASTIIEVSDLQAFVADPAKGVDVVGGIDSCGMGIPTVRRRLGDCDRGRRRSVGRARSDHPRRRRRRPDRDVDDAAHGRRVEVVLAGDAHVVDHRLRRQRWRFRYART